MDSDDPRSFAWIMNHTVGITNGGVADGDVPHTGRAAGAIGELLSAHAAVGGGVEADCGSRARNKTCERSHGECRGLDRRTWF